MKKTKKLVALLLVFAMCVAMVQTPVLAGGNNHSSMAKNFKNKHITVNTPIEEEITSDDQQNVVVGDVIVTENVEEKTTETEESTVEVENTEEEIAVESTTEDVQYPAQTFNGKANGISVSVDALAGAFPEGTVMTVTKASEDAVQAAADAVDASVKDVIAVDISFSVNGKEIEPEAPINVTMKNEAVAEADDVVIVHVDDQAKTEIVQSVVKGEEVSFKADAFSVYAIVNPDNRTTVNFYYNGSVVNTQIIKGDEKLYDPSSEVDLPEGTQFKGWHLNSTTGTLYTIDELNAQTLTGTVSVYAETFRAYSVQYKDGDTLLKNEIVELAGSATSATYTVNQPYEVASQSQTFVGWMVQGTDTVYANGTEISVTGNLVLVPKTAEGYWLTFNENGAGATYVSPVFVENGKSATKPADPTRPGYTFAGWYTAAEGGSKYTFGTLSANTTVYAHWTMNATASYTVNYWRQKVTDNVNATDAQKTYDYVESTTKTATSGTTVSGSNDKTYQYFKYNNNNTNKNVVVEPDGTTVINVYYDRYTVDVKFYNGSGSTLRKTVTGLYQQELPDGAWDTSTYNWSRKANNTSAIAVLLTSFDPFTAGYSENTTTNTSTGKITTNFYSINKVNGTIYYYNEQADGTFKQVATANASSLTIHEKFEGYDLYRKWNGRTGSGSSSKWTPTATTTATFFDGYGSTCKDGDSAPFQDDRTFIISKLKSYNLNYMVDGKNVKSETMKYTTSLAGKDTFIPTTPSGEMFVGWFADPAGTVAYDFAHSTMPIGGVTVYAKFEAIQYRVFLNVNGGTLPEGQAADFRVDYGSVVQATALQEPLFTKEGYTLIGWYTDAAMTNAYNFATHIDQNVIDTKGDNTYREDAHSNVLGKLNLYAKWRKNPDATSTFKVEYDAADGTNAPVDETPYNDSATVTVSTGATAPSGKVFDHWVLLKADGSESANTYAPGETFAIDSAYSVEKDGKYVITLKAVYVEKHTTFLKYDANEGGEFKAGVETEIDNMPMNSDVTLLGADAIETKTDYVLLGWNQNKKAADAGTVEFEAGQTVAVDNMEDSANTLYAVWKKPFYVYHSSTAKKTTHYVNPEDPSFDITALVAEGYLYGGYYSEYADKGTKYTGASSSWDATKAYIASGKTMAPKAGETYYLKEVPEAYVQASNYEIYHDKTHVEKKFYLVSTIDDANYREVGFKIGASETNLMSTLTNSFAINYTDPANSADYWNVTLTAPEFNAVPAGLIAYTENDTILTAGKSVVYRPYYTTLDGVQVYGKLQRTAKSNRKVNPVTHESITITNKLFW